MSFIKNLKSLFVVEESTDIEATADVEEKAASINTPTRRVEPEAIQSPASSVVPESVEGEVNNKFLEVLMGALQKNNLEGIDYLEFRQSLISLKKMPMDEATKFQSAFAMAQTMGATPAKLLETAQYYIDILKKEESKFELALKGQQEQQINLRKSQMAELKKSVQLKAEQIKTLTESIQKDQSALAEIEKEIVGADAKLTKTKNDFFVSYQFLEAQIKEDVQKMKTYLK